MDLADNGVIGGFSSVDIVRSIALACTRNNGAGIDRLLISLEDVMQALKEVKGMK